MMQWWAWVAVGAILLGSELTFVNAQFYLVFIGGAALLVGFAHLVGLELAPWAQWTAFAVLALVSMVLFRRRIYERLRRRLPVMHLGPEHERVTVPEGLAAGATCRVEFRGSTWEAVNAGDATIPAGGRARIERIDRLTLVLRLEE